MRGGTAKEKALGRRVMKMRKRRHLEIADLAKLTGLTYQTLWRIERGQQGEPGGYTVVKIAQALGCTTDYVLGMQEDDENSERKPATAA